MAGLVVYYSHEGQNSVNFDVQQIKKGHTRTVAEKIAELTGSDIYRIIPQDEYPMDYEACCKRAREESEANIHPAIKDPISSIDAYDTIYLGFPIWYRSYPRVIASFIDLFDFTGKTVYPFCTNEEGGFGLADMELGAPVKNKGGRLMRGLAVRGSNAENCETAVKNWLLI